MATRPELHIAVAKTKSKASDYNDNFEMMMDYCETVALEDKTYVDDFMPSVTGQSGKFLTNDGTSTSWASVFTGNNTFSGTNSFTGDVTVSGSSFAFTRCTTKPTTTSTASDSKVAVVVQNYLSGNSWYRVWSDGFIEQGGVTTVSASNKTSITLLKPYTSTSYNIQATIRGNSYSSSGIDGAYAIPTSTSQFDLVHDYVNGYQNNDIQWVAFGY